MRDGELLLDPGDFSTRRLVDSSCGLSIELLFLLDSKMSGHGPCRASD
jgi:hypothetical protein